MLSIYARTFMIASGQDRMDIAADPGIRLRRPVWARLW